MINWSDALSFSGWDIKHPFWNARELKELKDFLTNLGLLGSHDILAEGFEDEGITYSEGTLVLEPSDPFAFADQWVYVLEETVGTSPQGFNYPLNRADQSNAKQGYKNAINNQKAGNEFVSIVKEMLEETLYEYGDSLEWSYRIKPWAFKVVEAMGDIGSETNQNDAIENFGTLSWTIDIDPMGIYKDVEE